MNSTKSSRCARARTLARSRRAVPVSRSDTACSLDPRHFAYIKISEGCDHPCTFCVIPQYRGANRSRRPESVITEASRLFAQGVREINLIGQDTTAYGEDWASKTVSAHLLGRLARDRDRLSRSGFVFSTRIRTGSPVAFWTPGASMIRS